MLLKHGADVASKNINRQAPLHLASWRGHADFVQEFLGHGADVNAQDDRLGPHLHQASAAGHLKTCQLLVRRGAALEMSNKDQETPCDVASRET